MISKVILWPQAFIKGLEERRRDVREVKETLQARGITVEDIAASLVKYWKSKNVTLKQATVERAIKRALSDPMLQNAIMLGLELDQKAEREEDVSDIVRQLIVNDDPLCNVDELLAKAALPEAAIDRFHQLDMTKVVTLMQELDSQSNQSGKKQVNMFADDLVAAIIVMAERKLGLTDQVMLSQESSQKGQEEIQQSEKKRSRPDHVRTKKLRKEVQQRLAKAGLTVELIAEVAYQSQRPFNPDLEIDDATGLTRKLLGFGSEGGSTIRELYYAILFLTEIDRIRLEGKFSSFLMQRFQNNGNDRTRNPLSLLQSIVNEVAFGDIARAKVGYWRLSGNERISQCSDSPVVQELGYVLAGNAAHMIADQQRQKAERPAGKIRRVLQRGVESGVNRVAGVVRKLLDRGKRVGEKTPI